MNTLWTDEVIEQLTKLWKEGVSASQIAIALGPDFTKNAVIGKVHRLKLSNDSSRPARPKSSTSKPKSSGVSRTQRSKARTVARTTIDQFHASRLHEEPIPDLSFVLQDTVNFGSSAAILDLKTDTCKWPVGDPLSQDFRFCNASCEGTYCTHHQTVAYRSTRSDQGRSNERLYA